MADTGRPDEPDEGSSLEMPSFSLRRKKRSEQAPPASGSYDQGPTPGSPAAVVPADVPAVEPPDAALPPAHAEPRRRRRLPTVVMSGVPAAAVTGVVVGALAVLLSWIATSTCDVVRGTSSCGGGPGLLILVAVLVLLAYAGSLLLRLLGVSDAGSTSLLAVGILAVLVLVFLLGSIDQWWMVIAIPLAAVIAYCVSWWVTHAVVGTDAEPDVPEPHDVR